MKQETKTLGQAGEKLAAEFLRQKGHLILEQNYHSPFGEIDSISIHNDILIFTEVKTRTKVNIVATENCISLKKRIHITKTAQHYLASHPEQAYQSSRFDIIIIFYNRRSDTYQIIHQTDAFQPIFSDN